MKEGVIDSRFRFLQKQANDVGFYINTRKKRGRNPYEATFWQLESLYDPHREKIGSEKLEYLWDLGGPNNEEGYDPNIWFPRLTIGARSIDELLSKIDHHLEHVFKPRVIDINISDKDDIDPNKIVPIKEETQRFLQENLWQNVQDTLGIPTYSLGDTLNKPRWVNKHTGEMLSDMEYIQKYVEWSKKKELGLDPRLEGNRRRADTGEIGFGREYPVRHKANRRGWNPRPVETFYPPE